MMTIKVISGEEYGTSWGWKQILGNPRTIHYTDAYLRIIDETQSSRSDLNTLCAYNVSVFDVHESD